MKGTLLRNENSLNCCSIHWILLVLVGPCQSLLVLVSSYLSLSVPIDPCLSLSVLVDPYQSLSVPIAPCWSQGRNDMNSPKIQ